MRRLLTLVALSGLVAFHALPVFAADGDGDLVEDEVDVCPDIADPFQADLDGDGIGDLCEPDTAGGTTFDGTPEGELIIGTSGADTLFGADGNDAIYGLEGDDTLDGGEGRDFLSGGPGADTLTGGAGCDVFALAPVGEQDLITDFDPAVDRMTFPAPAQEVNDDPLASATFGGDDHLVVTFGEGDDAATLEFEGLPAGEQIVLSSGPCFTPPEEEIPPPEEPPFECAPMFEFEFEFDEFLPLDGMEVFGTVGDDALEGTDCSDIIVGDATLELDSEDLLADLEEQTCDIAEGISSAISAPVGGESQCGDDTITGLAGNDLLIGDKLILTTLEIGGDDTIHGGEGDDIIIGDAGIIAECVCGPLVFGADVADGPVGGDDELFGDEGDDLIFGDAVVGLLGISYGGNDSLYGGDGDDLLVGEGFVIVGGGVAGDDYLDGGDGDDEIYGDAILGIDGDSAAGDDVLIGGAGDDLLVGDSEVDGEAGQDTFVYDADSDFGDDTIVDLGTREVVDTIQFSGTGLIAGDDLTELDARSFFEDDLSDPNNLLATVYAEAAQINKVGSIVIVNAGGLSITSWTTLEGSWIVDVVIV